MAGSAVWIEKTWVGPEGQTARTGEKETARSKARFDELRAAGFKVKKGGPWYVVWREPGTTRKTYETFSTFDEARDFRSDTEKALRVGNYVPKADREIALGAYIETVLENSRKLRPSTLGWYRYHYEHYVKGTRLAQRPIGGISSDVLNGWFKEQGFKNGTEQAVRRLLTKALNSAVKKGILGASPLRDIEFARPTRREVEPLPIEVIESLADAIEPRYRAVVLLAAYGGLRAGEIGGLRLQDLDFDACEIRVRQAVVTVGGSAVVGDVKTDAARRTVDIPQDIAAELRQHVEEFGTAEDGRIFTTPPRGDSAPNGLVSHFTLGKAFSKAIDRLDLEPRPRFHDLRHTCAALKIEGGAHPKIIQQQLGHSSIVVTMDVYGSLFPGLGQESAQEVNSRRQKVLASGKRPALLAETVDAETVKVEGVDVERDRARTSRTRRRDCGGCTEDVSRASGGKGPGQGAFLPRSPASPAERRS